MSDLEGLGRTLAQQIGEIEKVYERRWEKRETQNLRVEDKERRLEAHELLKAILPPMMRAPRGELVNRISCTGLVEAAQRWSWSDGNMLFAGPTAVGKTSAAALLIQRLIRLGLSNAGQAWERAKGIVFSDVRALCSRVKEHGMGRGEAEDLRSAKYATLLVLDDLARDADVGTITEILNHRYQYQRQTVTTTGLTLEQLDQALGEACARRLYESAGSKARLVGCFPR